MALSTEAKSELIKENRINEKDCASPQVQIALMTARLNQLNKHFKENSKDHHSRRGLMKIVGNRRNLLDYLAKSDNNAYKSLITKLGIRK